MSTSESLSHVLKVNEEKPHGNICQIDLLLEILNSSLNYECFSFFEITIKNSTKIFACGIIIENTSTKPNKPKILTDSFKAFGRKHNSFSCVILLKCSVSDKFKKVSIYALRKNILTYCIEIFLVNVQQSCFS